MAGIAVSVTMGVMKPILDKLGALMGNEYKRLKGLQKEVCFLEHELSAINALLMKMDTIEELDPQSKNWRKVIIEMAYDIEDYIDEFMNCVDEAGDKVGILQKASHYLRTFKDRRHLANKIQEIKTLVIEASERRKRYMIDGCISNIAPVVVDPLISNTTHLIVDPRLSALYKESASLVGIDNQKEELFQWVMNTEEQLKVMSIVGSGGLGKTTLANEVYREVGSQFNCKAFVSVSQKPDMIGLLISIYSQIESPEKKTALDVCMMENINKIRNCLLNKRYFIIVDDLWDVSEWNNVISCLFPNNNQHSRVIVTTRNENVAIACSSNHKSIHRMEPLSKQDSRKLFCNRIFGSDDSCPPHLEELSCEILKKCGGLPLAIITVASILACQPTRLKEQWLSIQNSLSSKSTTKSTMEDMMHILDLSYKNLPSNLKACFLYLGTYPEDYKISKVDLVRRWVAEGFVSNSPVRDVWDVAESYFNELANRSMIQPTYDKDNTFRVSHCKVHDMMLELIIRKCREYNFMSLANGTQILAEGQDEVNRRLTIILDGAEDGGVVMTTMRNLSKVRSLSKFGGSNWMIPKLQEFRSLRILFLGVRCYLGSVDLTVINQLSQLRYFKVNNEGLYESSLILGPIGNLRHLETLELPQYAYYIPPDIVDLPRLSHLDLEVQYLPKGIGKVKSLRHLGGVILTSVQGIEELGQLTNLTVLSFGFGFVYPELSAAWKALSSSLEKLGNLKCLVVKRIFHEGTYADGLGVSWVLAPFCDLERFDLSPWIFSGVPKWMK